MDKQMIEEMAKKYPVTDKDKLFNVVNSACDLVYMRKDNIERIVNALYNAGYRKIPENAVVLTRDELDEVLDTCKCAMVVTDDDGKKYVSLDDYAEYNDRLGKIARRRKVRIEYLEKLLDDRCDRCIERVRKETAEKFAERLKEKISSMIIELKANWATKEVEGFEKAVHELTCNCILDTLNTVKDLTIDEICKELEGENGKIRNI